MTVNAKDLPTNNLYINEIEQNIRTQKGQAPLCHDKLKIDVNR